MSEADEIRLQVAETLIDDLRYDFRFLESRVNDLRYQVDDLTQRLQVLDEQGE